jgi:hypothetical protein
VIPYKPGFEVKDSTFPGQNKCFVNLLQVAKFGLKKQKWWDRSMNSIRSIDFAILGSGAL